MIDTAGQDREFRALDVRGEELRILGGGSDGIGRTGDNLHRDRDLLQAFGRKRASDGRSYGKDVSDVRIAIGIAGALQGLLHVGLLFDGLKLLLQINE